MSDSESIRLVDHAKPITEIWVGVFQREGILSEVILTGVLQMEMPDGSIGEVVCFTVEWHETAVEALTERCEAIVKDKLLVDGEVWTYRLLHFQNPEELTPAGIQDMRDLTWRQAHGER